MQHFMPTRIVGGKHALEQNAGLLRKLGARCLLVTGGSSAKMSGALDAVTAALEQQGIAWTVFDQIGPNPLVSACYAAGEMARAFDAQFIFGIGGGSPLDAAKAAAIYAANPSLAPMDIFAMAHKTPALPIVLLGTTAGTGSEVTRISVLTQDKTGRKRSIAGDDLYAHIAFADARFTHSMPFSVSYSTAMDALSHAIEGWIKAPEDDLAAMFARQAIPPLWEGLTAMQRTGQLPDDAMRARLYEASLYAGLVINIGGTAFCHPMGYVLTEDYSVPHGMACGVFLPALLGRIKRFLPGMETELLQAFSPLGFETMDAVGAQLAQLAALPEIRMEETAVQGYADYWRANPPKNFAASPGGLEPEEAAGLLKSLFC